MGPSAVAFLVSKGNGAVVSLLLCQSVSWFSYSRELTRLKENKALKLSFSFLSQGKWMVHL